jgi:hypothetical protein
MTGNDEFDGTQPDLLAEEAIECFQGRDIMLFEELPPYIPPATIAALCRRKALRVVAVSAGKKRKLAWRLVH